ncbi:MAG: DUF3098 domain-containing protein [Cytophagales bacterium]
MLFGKNNYKLLIAGILVLILGFTLMSMDTAEYGFGSLGLWVGPLVIMSGFIIEFFAIFAKSE